MHKFLRYGIAALMLFSLSFCLLFRIVTVHGNSMENTIKDGDILMIQKRFVDYHVGDIVIADIIRFDTKEEDTIVKRLIATAGQTVEIKNGVVYVDGKKIKEDYLESVSNHDNYKKITVPKGYVYLLGDNRSSSFDSRLQGVILKANLHGKMIAHITT